MNRSIMKSRASATKSSEESSSNKKAAPKARENGSHKKGSSKDEANTKKFMIIPITLFLAVLVAWLYQQYVAGLVNTPLNAPKVINESSYKSPENLDRYWGTYRSFFSLSTCFCCC